MNTIFDNIQSAFNSLWKCIDHGNTIEIVTPYSTVNNMFVSIFVTQQNGEYVVTDGGWVCNDTYECGTNCDDQAYTRLFNYYTNEYAIKTLYTVNETFYYKTTPNVIFVPNLVYDLANFISAIVSSSFVQFSDTKEEKETKRFSRSVREFIATILPNQAKFDQPINQDYQSVKFSAIITSRPDRMVLVANITGSSLNYFTGSIGKATMNFEIIKNSPLFEYVDSMIPIIDNTAYGYQQKKVAHQILNLQRQVDGDVLLWTEKERLAQRIA